MNLKKATLITSHTLLCLAFGVSVASPQVELQYQNRGNRNEGIRSMPVSGGDIELISAVVNYREASRQSPDLFRLKLYLQQQTQVYVIVREIDNKHGYWMDKVRPSQPWKA